MTAPLYNHVHRKQLFNWVGRHIELGGETDRVLSNTDRVAYLECLRHTLRDGLWLQKPGIDRAINGRFIELTQPMVCFTEWSLSESKPHASKYGRMAFGFSKQFVLKNSGQPVAYFRDSKSKSSLYSDALKQLKSFFGTLDDNDPVRAQFAYIEHFHKPISKVQEEMIASGAAEAIVRPKRIKSRKQAPDKRRWGKALHYLEEREWRIVYSPALKKIKPGRPDGGPDFLLPFKAGIELYTVVLPDSGTVRMAMQDEQIRAELYPADGAHVTVLSFDDIGTF